MLESEPDFRNQKPLLVEAVEAAGGKVLFGTKFHPELMPIENAYRSRLFQFNPKQDLKIFIFRDISAFMKRNNTVGISSGYVERVCDSYSTVDVKNVG